MRPFEKIEMFRQNENIKIFSCEVNVNFVTNNGSSHWCDILLTWCAAPWLSVAERYLFPKADAHLQRALSCPACITIKFHSMGWWQGACGMQSRQLSERRRCAGCIPAALAGAFDTRLSIWLIIKWSIKNLYLGLRWSLILEFKNGDPPLNLNLKKKH
jgi:hypothetical protein